MLVKNIDIRQLHVEALVRRKLGLITRNVGFYRFPGVLYHLLLIFFLTMILNICPYTLFGFNAWSLHLSQEVFHLNLELLNLSNNRNLTVILPKVKRESSAGLQHLHRDGGIPDSIGNLDSSATLSLSGRNLSGIPKSVGNLRQLTCFGIYENSFNGPILTTLSNLTNLTHLSLSDNNFTSPLPTGLFSHPSLEKLDLNSTGDAEISLVWVDLSSNETEREILHWIGI